MGYLLCLIPRIPVFIDFEGSICYAAFVGEKEFPSSEQLGPFGDQDSEPKPLFSLGRLVGTSGALNALTNAEQNPFDLLVRHVTGDWGDLEEEDKKENELSVREGYRILSAYELETGAKVWVITEADRSSTTILLPEEY